MGDVGEYWREHKEHKRRQPRVDEDDLGSLYRDWGQSKKEKKAANLTSSLEILDQNGIEAKRLSDTHYRIGDLDFWPSTGLFINRKTQNRGRGVFNLIKLIKGNV